MDFKLENIVFYILNSRASDPVVKLIDFGVAYLSEYERDRGFIRFLSTLFLSKKPFLSKGHENGKMGF
jgi:hypothetical protein